MTLQVRTITAEEHRVYVAARSSVPLEQTPGWGRGFVTARTESVGWFDGGVLLGAGMVRYRSLPRLPMRSVAVFEAGPDIDWTGRRRIHYGLADWLDPLARHLHDRGVFTARVNPPIAAREWWRFDPRTVAATKDVVLHREREPLQDSRTTTARLRDAGWRLLPTATPAFVAEVVLTADDSPGRSGSGSTVAPGYAVRTGTPDDLEAVHAALASAHPGIPMPSAKDLAQRWRGLTSDDFAGVTLLVVERAGRIVYGGLLAVVGDRAWDLSVALPLPDADGDAVQLLRRHVMQRARQQGARTLTVPTVVPQRRAPARSPAPGWPPVHLSEQMGTWQLGVRATWHGVLAPVVDRLVL